MRYFAELAYNGTNYIGWQKQPNGQSVQSTIENSLSTILQQKMDVVGCGRTDTGVHAKQYFLHFELEKAFPKSFLFRLNKILPKDISIRQIFEVADSAHARFDATHRAYEYHLDIHKNPFGIDTAYYYPYAEKMDFKQLQEAAKLLLSFDSFYTFCKSNTDVKTMNCQLFRSEWIIDEANQKLVFHIAANRFLRGMVRLIVGMCLNVGSGKLRLEQVQIAMEKQERLPKSLSVPPQGLFLTDIRYPFIDVKKTSFLFE